MNTTTLHTDGFYSEEIFHQTVVKDGELMYLEVHNTTDRDGNKKRVAYNLLPAIRKSLADKGYDDFCFGPDLTFGGNWRARHYEGIHYEDCDDVEALYMEFTGGHYRSLEARDLLKDLLLNKFHYHEWVENFEVDGYKQSISYITDKDYNTRLGLIEKRNEIIELLKRGEELEVRIPYEIQLATGGPHKGLYYTDYVTCKKYRASREGGRLHLYFDPSIKMQPYKNHKEYFHVLEDGKPIKTRTHYCIIKGKPIIDEKKIGEYDDLGVLVESIRLVEK